MSDIQTRGRSDGGIPSLTRSRYADRLPEVGWESGLKVSGNGMGKAWIGRGGVSVGVGVRERLCVKVKLTTREGVEVDAAPRLRQFTLPPLSPHHVFVNTFSFLLLIIDRGWDGSVGEERRGEGRRGGRGRGMGGLALSVALCA